MFENATMSIQAFIITTLLVLAGIGLGIYLVIRLMIYFDEKNDY